MKLILIRHGEPNYACVHCGVNGNEPAELTDSGKRMAGNAAGMLSDKKISAILTSPLMRAVKTADILKEKLGIEMIIEDDLREWESGLSPHGSDKEAYNRLFSEFIQHKGVWSDDCEFIWEDINELGRRFFGVLRKYNDEKTYVVVGHKMIFGQMTDTRHLDFCEYIEIDGLPAHWNGFVEDFSKN